MGLDRDFLTMLNAWVVVAAKAGEDSWGNTSFDAPRPERAYIDPLASTFGATDGTTQESTVVTRTTLTMDAVGIRPGDRITLPSGTMTYVTSVDTAQDEVGADLYQTVTVQNTERG